MAKQVARFMGGPSKMTGTWTGSITVIMAAGSFKFKAMALSRMDDPEVEAKEDIMVVSLQANVGPTRKHVCLEPDLNQEMVKDALAT